MQLYKRCDRLTCRDWALIIPCYLMLVVLLAYLVYAGLTVYLTPPFDAANLVTGGSRALAPSMLHKPRQTDDADRHAHIPAMQDGKERYHWASRGKDIMPPAVDLPIDVMNRTLYPPRPRPSPVVR
jgi:phosphatidylinositol glycan class P protein